MPTAKMERRWVPVVEVRWDGLRGPPDLSSKQELLHTRKCLTERTTAGYTGKQHTATSGVNCNQRQIIFLSFVAVLVSPGGQSFTAACSFRFLYAVGHVTGSNTVKHCPLSEERATWMTTGAAANLQNSFFFFKSEALSDKFEIELWTLPHLLECC